ncbi:hypothetical protein ACFSTD_04370 [Novosphingobium colocasiae]
MGTALAKVWANRFAPQVSPLTKAYLEGTAPRAPADLAGAMRAFAANPGDAAAVETLSASPAYVGVIRTTCVPTQITGGHAPQRAAAAGDGQRQLPHLPRHQPPGHRGTTAQDHRRSADHHRLSRQRHARDRANRHSTSACSRPLPRRCGPVCRGWRSSLR